MDKQKAAPAKPGGTPQGASPFNRTVQHDAKRAAILSQAARLFNGRGSRSTTLLDIAQSLGLTKTSLYYYVRTKEELIYQCYMAALDTILEGLDSIERSHQTGFDRIMAALRAHFVNWREAQDGQRNHTAALLEIASLKDRHREEVEQRYIEMFLRMRQYIRDGIQEGNVRPVESTAATLGLLGSMQWSFDWLRSIPPANFDDLLAAVHDIIAHGFARKPGDFSFGSYDFTDGRDPNPVGFDRAQRNRLKQEAFYKTGTWFFNKKGFVGTSLDEIAEELQVTKGAFYYHIKSKEDLLYHCYLRSLEMLEEIHEAAQSLPDGLARVDYTLRRTFHVQNSDDGPMIRYNTITALPLPRRREILRMTDESNNRFGQFMRDGIEDGSVRPLDVNVAQHLITGAMNASMDLPLWRRVDDVNLSSIDYYDMFFSGLSPEKPGVS